MAEEQQGILGETNAEPRKILMWPDYAHPTNLSCNYNQDIIAPFDAFCVIRGYSPATTSGTNDNMSWSISLNGASIHSWNGVNNSSWFPVSVFVKKGDVIHLWSNMSAGSMSGYFFPLIEVS